MSSKISIARLVVRFVVWFGIVFALLFGGAGTIAWPEAWLYLFIQITFSAVMARWLRKHNPELLQARMTFWKRVTERWDKIFMLLFIVVSVPFLILPGLDAIRYQWSHVPLSIELIGFTGILVSSVFIFWVLKTNPYASAVVEIQEDREHKTITTGPYEYVRHPMYAGAIVGFLFIPFALGSLLTLVPGIILAVLIVRRTQLEDKTLHEKLKDYAAYAETVKYRLIPGIW